MLPWSRLGVADELACKITTNVAKRPQETNGPVTELLHIFIDMLMYFILEKYYYTTT